MRSGIRGLSAAIVAFALVTPAAEAARKSWTSGQWGGVSAEIPEGWTATFQRPDQPGGAAIVLRPPGDTPLILLMTPLPLGGSEEPSVVLKRLADEIRASLLRTSVEKALTPRELRGAGCRGLYHSATDKTVERPTATNFRYVDQGGAIAGRFLITFTLLTNDPEGASRDQARKIVESLEHVLPGPPWRNADGTVAMAFPGKSWKLRLALPGFAVDPLTPKTEEPGVRLLARNPKTGVIVSAFLERSPEGWTAVRHREDALVKMQAGDGMKRDSLRRSERGDAAILEYQVAEYRGERIDQKSMNSYRVKDGVWIDVHVSKEGYRPEDQTLLDAVIDSVRIEE